MTAIDTLSFKKGSHDAHNAMIAGMKARIPVMLVGAPGTSKTATVRSLADQLGYDLITIVPSRMDPQDISGFPTKGQYTYDDVMHPVTEYAAQKWQMEILEKKTVILFLDEFSNANPSVRASLLSFIQDRQFPNGQYFPEETVLVAAMNPTDSAADGSDLDPATTNRIMFVSWEPNKQDWYDGMPDNWGRGVKNETEAKWRNLIVRFIKDNPGFLHVDMGTDMNTTEAYGINPNNSSDRTVLESAWPSRRSWDNLSMALGSVDKNDPNLEDIIMRGLVGARASHSFRDWLRKHGKIDIKKILSDPDSYTEWATTSQDDINMILRSALDSVDNDTIENVIRIFQILPEIGKPSYGASFLNEFASSAQKLKGVDSARLQELRQMTIATIKKYKEINDRVMQRNKKTTA